VDHHGPVPGDDPKGHGGFGSYRHLAVRFAGGLDPRGPAGADEAWARRWLVAGEVALWRRMSGPDRRHAVGVARRAAALLAGREVEREVMAAALLHDVGKIESDLGTFARAAVTAAALVAGRDRLAAGRSGWRRRVSDYLAHDRIGGRLLAEAGSHPTTISWAAEHHLPPTRWSVDREVGAALAAADGD
jgi:hypothetical protein